jgi:hypothetical protein
MGVLVGATHTGVYHALLRKGYVVSRVFIGNRSTERGVKIRYTSAEAAVRRQVFGHVDHLNHDLAKRMMLEHCFTYAIGPEYPEVVARYVANLSTKEIEDMLDTLESLKPHRLILRDYARLEARDAIEAHMGQLMKRFEPSLFGALEVSGKPRLGMGG